MKPCAICGELSPSVDLLYHLPDYDVLVCLRCGLVYTNENFKARKGEGIPEGYQAIYLPAERSFVARFQRNIGQIESFAGHRGRLLDVGCGVGYFLRVARERGWSVAGVDLDKAAVDIARQHGLDVHWETVEEMSFAEAEFDVVTLFNVIEHLSDPQIAVERIYKVLKPQGLFVLETPTDDFLLKHLARFLYYMSSGLITWPIRYLYGSQRTTGHVYRFSRGTITKLLERVGFEVLSIRAAENPPFRLYLSQRNFRKGLLVKLLNFVILGMVFCVVKLSGIHSRMVVYGSKVER